MEKEARGKGDRGGEGRGRGELGGGELEGGGGGRRWEGVDRGEWRGEEEVGESREGGGVLTSCDHSHLLTVLQQCMSQEHSVLH